MTRKEITEELEGMREIITDPDNYTTEELVDKLQYERCCNCVEYPEMDRMKHCNKCELLIELDDVIIEENCPKCGSNQFDEYCAWCKYKKE